MNSVHFQQVYIKQVDNSSNALVQFKRETRRIEEKLLTTTKRQEEKKKSISRQYLYRHEQWHSNSAGMQLEFSIQKWFNSSNSNPVDR